MNVNGGHLADLLADHVVGQEAGRGQYGIVWRGWQARVPAWQTIGAWVRRGREVAQLASGRDLFLGPAGYSEVTADAEGPCLAWQDDHVVVIAPGGLGRVSSETVASSDATQRAKCAAVSPGIARCGRKAFPE